MRRLCVLALVVGAALAGCGADAPTDASRQDFCRTHASLHADLSDLVDAEDREVVHAIRDWGARTERVGTPARIPARAREGFEVETRMAIGLDETTPAGFFADDDLLSRDEQAALDAFDAYVTKTCGAPAGERPRRGR